MINPNHKESKEESIETYPYSKIFQTVDDSQFVSVLSWNVMHKDFVNVSVKRKATYNSLDDLIWNNRLPNIKSKISTSNADIVCLQEIDHNSFTHDIGNYFHEKHNYLFKVNYPKKKKKTKEAIDFSQAIMYKSSKFECEYEDYRGRAMILLLTNKLEKEKCNQCINSKNICIYHSFFIATVHLQSQGSNIGGNAFDNNELTRVNQIKSVLKRINLCITNKLKLNVSTETQNIRIIIVGDFNSFHEYDTAQMLLTNNNNNLKHEYRFKDAYHEQLISRDECHPRLLPNLRIKRFPTYAALGNIMSIDLLFYTISNFKLKGITNTLPDNMRDEINWNKRIKQRIDEWIQRGDEYMFADYKDILQIPNKQIPSDHFPIGAIFEFDNLCNINNTNGNEESKCRCCVEEFLKKKTKQKKGNNQRRKGWHFHEINSF